MSCLRVGASINTSTVSRPSEGSFKTGTTRKYFFPPSAVSPINHFKVDETRPRGIPVISEISFADAKGLS
ncbi:MAG: hypothetical protein K9W43_06060 [Candidatus Thorarchaeota archaeon]|nr:hypothetical protein [Candidatus Thorarchaeota archaeon]